MEQRNASKVSIHPATPKEFDRFVEKNAPYFAPGVMPGTSAGRISFFAKSKGKIVGVMQVTPEKTFAEVVSNAVHSDYRSRGVNTQMLSLLAGWLEAKGFRSALITARGRNPKRYPSRGPFKKVGGGFLAWKKKTTPQRTGKR